MAVKSFQFDGQRQKNIRCRKYIGIYDINTEYVIHPTYTIYLRTFVVFSLSPAPVRSVMIRSCCPVLALSGARRLFFARWTGFGPPTISTWLRWDAARAGDRSSCPGVSVSSKLYHVTPVFFFFGGWRFSPIPPPPLFSCGTRAHPRRKHTAFPISTSVNLVQQESRPRTVRWFLFSKRATLFRRGFSMTRGSGHPYLWPVGQPSGQHV